MVIGYSMGSSPTPTLRRWMLFVDGENLTFRAQKVAAESHVDLAEGPYYSRDTFVWAPGIAVGGLPVHQGPIKLEATPLRAHYYTSVVGDEDRLRQVREALRELQFSPEVFKKPKQADRAKGVDIALAKDVLGHAYFGNYDVAVLVAGDGDYLPLLEEIKRLGRVVYVAFFAKSGLNPDLRLAADMFVALDDAFLGAWRASKVG